MRVRIALLAAMVTLVIPGFARARDSAKEEARQQRFYDCRSRENTARHLDYRDAAARDLVEAICHEEVGQLVQAREDAKKTLETAAREPQSTPPEVKRSAQEMVERLDRRIAHVTFVVPPQPELTGLGFGDLGDVSQAPGKDYAIDPGEYKLIGRGCGVEFEALYDVKEGEHVTARIAWKPRSYETGGGQMECMRCAKTQAEANDCMPHDPPRLMAPRGGCGCDVAPLRTDASWLAGTLALVVLFIVRRARQGALASARARLVRERKE